MRAQQTLSEASDGVQISAEALRDAKAHCAACDSCLAYVSALAAIKKAPAPRAPEGTVSSVMAAVNEEIERQKAEEAAAAALLAAQAAGAKESALDDGSELVALEPVPRRDLGPYNWKGWAPWAAAAAVVFVLAGFAVMQGARFIAGTDSETSAVQPSGTGAPAPYEVESAETGADEEAGSFASPTQEGAEDAAYINFGEFAYRFERNVSQPSQLVTAGPVVTSLDTGEPAQQFTAYEGQRSGTLVVYDGDRYMEFELVQRSNRGRQYAMVIRPVTSFGLWPLPPAALQMPTSPDGSPVFVEANLDGHGQRTYIPDGPYPREGFAIAPGTPTRDPAEGNPNWTWWEPVR
jgi:hypothetical protein